MTQPGSQTEARRPGRLRRGIRAGGWWSLTAFVLVVIVFLAWANTVRVADRAAADQVFANPNVTVTDTPNSVILAPTDDAGDIGLVFIPGARVDPYAYLYKLAGTVEDTGATVVIAKPVLNLAILDQRPLSTFTDAVPDVSTWFVGGHSIGGVRACMLADDSKVDGLVLFGSYCATSPKRTDLRALSLSGSTDGLSTPEQIADRADLLPSDTRFVELEGVNHARFGDYGVENGDGVATAPTDAVAAEITNELSEFLLETTP
ncbi:alpha/beta hydrolase [Cryobacterium sinapicolor]|uniref:Alpha/beta hydrolase n=1 Tax=Cryobacterium sinapicolor TaxID=1259236 RepID=A0ABY2JB86_9MICO|nr:alpha/beta hydrolase [Cryobacterium sinapicolor]TFD02096.1 alpha/beta hydrolase [Cryobacterium sinapicolor]